MQVQTIMSSIILYKIKITSCGNAILIRLLQVHNLVTTSQTLLSREQTQNTSTSVMPTDMYARNGIVWQKWKRCQDLYLLKSGSINRKQKNRLPHTILHYPVSMIQHCLVHVTHLQVINTIALPNFKKISSYAHTLLHISR